MTDQELIQNLRGWGHAETWEVEKMMSQQLLLNAADRLEALAKEEEPSEGVINQFAELRLRLNALENIQDETKITPRMIGEEFRKVDERLDRLDNFRDGAMDHLDLLARKVQALERKLASIAETEQKKVDAFDQELPF